MVFKNIARFSVRLRWLILVLWLVAVPLAVKTLPSLTSVTKNDNSAFLPTNSASQKASDLDAPFQGGSGLATSTIVASRDSGPLTPADNAAITRLEQAVQHVSSVKVVRDQGVSKDGQVREILVGSSSSGFSPAALKVVTDVRHTFTTVSAPAGLNFHLTGTLAETADSNQSNNSTRNDTQGFTLIFIVVLLFLVYRSALAPLITLVPAALSLVAAGPIIAESTKFGVQVSPITQLLLIVLLLGAGTDYGLFLVFRTREELRRGLEPKEAVIQALSKVGEAITFSAATVGAALLSLLLASFGFYKGLGPALAIGLAVVLLAALTLLPALLAIFGRAAFWPSKVRQGTFKLGLWGRIAERVIRHPVITLVAGTILLCTLSLGLIGYKTGGFGNAAAPAGTDSAIGSKIIAAHFPATSNNPQILLLRFNAPVWNNLNAVAEASDQLAKAPEFSSVSGPLNPGGFTLPQATVAALYKELGPPNLLSAAPPAKSHVPLQTYELYRSLSQSISPDGKTIQLFAILSAGPSGSPAAAGVIPAARTRLQAVANNVGANANGVFSQDAFVYDISHTATSDLKLIVPVVLLIIAVLLAILLRSLVAPWYLIASVGLSYLATLGFSMIVFVHLNKSSDGLNFILPFLLFIFSMALGEDYNILVMTRIREEAHTADSLRQAVVTAIGITGNTVTSAGLILAGTFTVLGLSGGGNAQVEQIGFSIAFGILLDTFFVRTLLVPSVAVLLGRWNWWPSKLSRLPEPPQPPAPTPPKPKPKLVRL
jgi:putative drug exporter of the RND superfamily